MQEEHTLSDNILPILKDLLRLLSSAPLNVTDVQQKLAVLGVNAIVSPVPGKEEPAFVRLDVPVGIGLTLESLAQEFGPYKQLPSMHRGKAIKYIYRIDFPEKPYVCALIADQRRDASTIEAVTLRRDIRLK